MYETNHTCLYECSVEFERVQLALVPRPLGNMADGTDAEHKGAKEVEAISSCWQMLRGSKESDLACIKPSRPWARSWKILLWPPHLSCSVAQISLLRNVCFVTIYIDVMEVASRMASSLKPLMDGATRALTCMVMSLLNCSHNYCSALKFAIQ